MRVELFELKEHFRPIRDVLEAAPAGVNTWHCIENEPVEVYTNKAITIFVNNLPRDWDGDRALRELIYSYGPAFILAPLNVYYSNVATLNTAEITFPAGAVIVPALRSYRIVNATSSPATDTVYTVPDCFPFTGGVFADCVDFTINSVPCGDVTHAGYELCESFVHVYGADYLYNTGIAYDESTGAVRCEDFQLGYYV